MLVNKKLFGECYCPCEEIGRVCLRGDQSLPADIVKIAKEIDEEDYNPSCFNIDVFNDGALIYYVSIDKYNELFVCENADEVLEYYRCHVSEKDLEETFKNW